MALVRNHKDSETTSHNLGGPRRRTGYTGASQRRGRHPEALHRRFASLLLTCVQQQLLSIVIKTPLRKVL